jgi:uncharacterized protein (TIGR00255 family)
MVTSMTGFGRGTAEGPDGPVTVEIRTVNNRFLDVAVRGAPQATRLEERIRERIRTRMERGKISVAVTTESAAPAAPVLNLERARGYVEALRELAAATGVSGEPDLAILTAFRDVFTSPPEQVDEETDWRGIGPALEAALEACTAMRRREGEALAADLEKRIEHLAEGLAEVERLAPERTRAYAQRLRERIAELLNGTPSDRERLEQELVLYADRIDVSEECTRLHSHLAQFREAMAGSDSAGRTLNFLLQEMHREVNTVGSKANDAEMTRVVVAMKEELEKIREQVQNIE